MTSKLSVHWQRTHPQDDRDRAIFARWQPRSAKVITVGDDVKGAELIPPETLLVVRHHPMSENWGSRGIRDAAHARHMAATHASVCRALADWLRANVPARDLHHTVFTGLNEPEIWDREPPDLTALYYAAFLDELHKVGLHGMVGNLGVGQPTNGGVPDAPVNWQPFLPIVEAMRPGDYLGKHGYWDERGPEFNFKWWGGDWTQIPWNVPIIIGECGIDKYVSDPGVPAHKRGWRGWMSAQEYMNQLAWYDAKLRADKRVHSAQIFTFDYAHPWFSFDVREPDLMENIFLPFVESQHGTPEPPPASGKPDWLIDVVDTLPRHATLRYPQRMIPVTAVAIHHTATPPNTTLETIARYHISADPERNKEAWAGIGYHVVIAADGKTYLTQRLNTLSNHVYGNNAKAVGLSFIGNFTERPPTAAQMEAGRRALSWLLGELKLKPSDVRGHKDFPDQTTECPGNLPRDGWWRDLLSDAPPPAPDVTTARWQAEEAARGIEAAMAALAAARARLLEHTIPALYALEKD